MLEPPLQMPNCDTQPRFQRSFGEGRLHVKHDRGQTQIDQLFQKGCAKLRIPKPLTNHTQTSDLGLEAVMINSSGGMTGGDRLDWQFCAGPSTRLTVTTQACERIYAATDGYAGTNIQLSVAENARLAWLPQETILFDRGAFKRDMNVQLAPHANLLLAESVVFGRRDMDEIIEQGLFHDRWRIKKDGVLVHGEDLRISGRIDQKLHQSAIGNGAIAMASLLLISDRCESYLKRVQSMVGADGGVSYWQGKLLLRLLARDSYTLRQRLCPIIQLLNDGMRLPKIWSL